MRRLLLLQETAALQGGGYLPVHIPCQVQAASRAAAPETGVTG
jgi:hypothetical protein